MSPVAPYTLALCRPEVPSVFDAGGRAREGALDHNVGVFCELVARAAGDFGARLIVFPQFALTGLTPLGSDSWAGASMTFPGPELDRIGEAARRAGAYVVVPGSEKHHAFPKRYFVSAAIMTPAGDLGLTYRKNYTISLRLSPVDVYSRFVETFGAEAFMPVLDTPLGSLGVVIGAEPHYPELTRAMALKGAEVLLNPVSAQAIDYLMRPGADHVRAVRAFENVAYLAMANGVAGGVPSQAWDYQGRPVGGAASETDATFTLATIDIETLRQARSSPAENLLAQIQPQIAEDPRTLPLWPSDSFADRAPADADEVLAIEAQVWRGLQELGRGKASALAQPEPAS